jgi:elongation factor 3
MAVSDGAMEAISSVCKRISNKDIENLIPVLIKTMANPDLVDETVYALSATTFVQTITSSTLCILVPLLSRALVSRAKATQRKACVIIENMAKLVDTPENVKVFLPELLPLVIKVKEYASDPDNRGVAERTISTLERVLASALRTRGGEDGEDACLVNSDEGEVLCECDFSLAYGAKILLKNANLYLRRGKRYGLCGPNGAGKSTLLRAIVNGQVDGFPSADVLKTVYVEHEIDADKRDLTILQYLCDGSLGGVEDVVKKALVENGFNESLQSEPISSLSGGWKMKLSLTRAMLIKPDILMLDEPTNHMDVAHVAWLENYLNGLQGVSCIIVSHDSSFLDNVCTHILHLIDFKLHVYTGNLSAFVAKHPEAKSYYELEASTIKFKFPEPGFLEGVKTKDKAIIKIQQVGFTYPGALHDSLRGANVQCSLNSRIAVLGPNGAGKSTLIKLLIGELEPTAGVVWKHPNLRIAYVAQHAFHHLERHLDKTPMQYMQWRFATGEDRESEELATRQLTEEERSQIESKFVYNGEKRTIETLVSRRKIKKSYEYEVKWKDMTDDKNTWFPRDDLELMGFSKWVQELDQKEATRLGMVTRALIATNICHQFEDLGLEKEIAMHSRISGLSGGQKVKVVLATAMWLNPHVLIMDEPTNFLDRDSLGALAHAVKNYGGGVIIITHHDEFATALCKEVWKVDNGNVEKVGGEESETVVKQKILDIAQETEIVDALGNIVHVKGTKKTNLSNKDKKKLEKMKKARRERGEDVSSDEDD